MNAIILAAGMGTRLRPLTNERPKSLVEIAGESFFSRQIKQLREAGITDITVVTGYKAEAFAPWYGQDGLSFIHNPVFDSRNNLWSMLIVRERLGDTVVLDGDVRLADGLIPRVSPATSRWFVGYRDDMKSEWVVRVDGNDRVTRVDVAGGSGWILTGLSYWSKSDGQFLSGAIEEASKGPESDTIFWDEIPRRSLDFLDVRAQKIGGSDWAEIDTIEDKERLEAALALNI
ncbi:MAG: sugar phosphate nucleotidyltransferase [Treponemataceae bacterium]